ncbi:uncharacterized protein LOC126885962 isoform X1 [Diabrotica virgifera virgifera]|uniref:Transposable element P transposase-like RNase H domain-containing protein n=1 Tax=Diabrotica virgifera virgifera TaxID=50390 RepID=A0ABM5KEX4_DIAVI|nr:uncharacterized protein LOC126885962 isoform X1 [Diabrotica virgifera virgifera]
MELSEDSIKREQNVLKCHKDGDSLEEEQHVNVQVKSELECMKFETDYTQDSLLDWYRSDDIKIEHTSQPEISSPFPLIPKQEVKTELNEHNLGVNVGCETQLQSTNTEELDLDKEVKLEIGVSTEIHPEKHCRRTKTSKSLSSIGKQSNRINLISNHVIKPGETEKEAQSGFAISQDHCYTQSTRCMELNDHNYVSCSKEYNSEVTVNTTLTAISQDHCYAQSTRCMELNDHNSVSCSKEYNSEATVDTTLTAISQDHCYAQSIRCMKLNDHNYVSCSNEYNSEATVDTPLPFNETTEQGPKNILRQCGIRRNDLTPRKKKLYTEIRRLYKKYNHTKISKLSFKKRLAESEKFQKTFLLQENIDKLNYMSSLLIKCQFREADKSKKQRRFTIDEKIMALTLYKQSSRSYRFLCKIFILSSKATLHRLLIKIHFEPGLNSNIFQSLEQKVEKLDDTEKFVSLIFDEMSLMPGLNYNERQGFIEGFEDFGDGRSTYICDHVLFFMIRGIKSNIKLQ